MNSAQFHESSVESSWIHTYLSAAPCTISMPSEYIHVNMELHRVKKTSPMESDPANGRYAIQ